MEVKIVRRLLKANDEWAQKTRELLEDNNIFTVNLISSPGSGKTALLENTVEHFRKKYEMLVLEGDIATTRDAERIHKHHIPAVQLLTEGSCHLDANLVYKAVETNITKDLDILFIENVGNLVCPSEFDLGETGKVAVLSVAEGDDKVLKYPRLFREASCVILNKIDLLPYLSFDKNIFYKDMQQLNPSVPIIEVSCRTGEGIDGWYAWIEQKMIKQ